MHRAKSAYGGSGRLFVAHFHHGLRGGEAEADVDWLKALCDRLDLPLELGRRDVAALAAAQGDGWEAAARTARYEFLTSTAERLGADTLPQPTRQMIKSKRYCNELFAARAWPGWAVFRQVAVYQRAHVTLVRPMLNTRRRDVIEYLKALGQDFCTDSTNRDSRFNRNRVRHELLPMLRDRFNANVDEAVLLRPFAGTSSRCPAVPGDDGGSNCCRCIYRSRAVPAEFASRRLASGWSVVRWRMQPTIVLCEVFRFAWRSAGWPEQSMGWNKWRLLTRAWRRVASRRLSPTCRGILSLVAVVRL